MLVTNNHAYYERGKLLRSHGMTSLSYELSKGHSTTYDVIELGYNYRIDDIHSAIALAQLEKLRKDLEKRIQIRQRYINKLKPIDRVVIPFTDHQEFVSNYIFPIVLKDSNADLRGKIRAQLHDAGIQTSVHYPAAHRFSIFKQYNSQLAKTEYVTDNEITLPMYAKLSNEQVDYIADVLYRIL